MIKMNFKREVIRQTIHASGAWFILLENFFPNYLIGSIALLFSLIGYFIWYLDRRVYLSFISKILRTCRRNKKDKGFIYFFIGIGLTFLLFNNKDIINAAIIVLCFGDALSTIVGRFYGKHPFLFGEKTWEGFLTFLFTSFFDNDNT